MRTLLLALILLLSLAAPAGAAAQRQDRRRLLRPLGRRAHRHGQEGHHGQVELDGPPPAQRGRHAQEPHARFQSAAQAQRQLLAKKVTRGTYRIVCSIHAPDMRMKLVVE